MLSYTGLGRVHDPKFRGPVKNREMTNKLCCVLFLFFIIAYFSVGAYGLYLVICVVFFHSIAFDTDYFYNNKQTV